MFCLRKNTQGCLSSGLHTHVHIHTQKFDAIPYIYAYIYMHEYMSIHIYTERDVGGERERERIIKTNFNCNNTFKDDGLGFIW